MQYINVFKADWTFQEIAKLELEGIRLDENGIFQLTNEVMVNWVIKYFSSSNNFYHNKARVIFSDSELKETGSLMLQEIGPALTYPAKIGKNDEAFGYMKYAFGEICPEFGTPLQEQIRPITLAKEPKLPKKYIWGGFHGISGYILTDIERFEILHQKWGLEKREILIGSKQKVSKNFVQLDIPISKSPLCFGNSYFGKTLKLDGSGELSESFIVCPSCGNPIYTNQILDYFPTFNEEFDYDIVFTQEWFGWYRRLVISRKFADWLLENKYIEWNSNYIIPVKNFCK
jgi:hypothetical protein